MPSAEQRETILNSLVFSWLSTFVTPRFDELLHGFTQEFLPSSGVQLVIKTKARGRKKMSLGDIEKRAAKLLKMNKVPSNVLFYSGFGGDNDLAEPEYAALYHATDAFVLPTHAEGWCRPCMEAMACGKTAIVTGWSAVLEFMNNENSMLINYTLGAVPDSAISTVTRKFQHKEWATASVPHLRQLMRSAVTDEALRAKLGRAARLTIEEQFSRKAIGLRMQKRLGEISSGITSSKACSGTGSTLDRREQVAASHRHNEHKKIKALHHKALRLMAKGTKENSAVVEVLKQALEGVKSKEMRSDILVDLCSMLYTVDRYDEAEARFETCTGGTSAFGFVDF